MRPLLLTLFLAALPLLFGYWVNTHAPYPPTRSYTATHCTRYCTLYGCRHATAANSPAYFQLKPLYAATVRALAVGGRGWYAAVNVGFYLLFVPAVLLWLTYGAIRNAFAIRQLKQNRAA
ncbi:hypothetical protein Q5H93_22910 [Hymenobacter sp. ASUV-10]|uniref:DUF2752 domain-containing protein n=1 Tax=Hymenobacter aranciens TaxID=3063996 RepID=A0ABT9BH57_9BACT|nr:hypothetical protein [Hymenobacter sp. ASUV-10]MDO7877608.1 hypothetical protein [Hymenobacter sp. ASUV-10]